MNMIHPLALTSDQWASSLFALFGRGRQQALALYKTIFRHGSIRDGLPEFANAPKLFEAMSSKVCLTLYPIAQLKEDGQTVRFLLKTPDGHLIESVLITMQHGKTICVSSQIGCRMGCRFCQTGTLGLIRHLSVDEIIQQVFVARHILKVPVNNVVFMGMGEPFDNYEAVCQAVRILQDPIGLSIGARHISISTSGDIEGIKRFSLESFVRPNLTVSINAPNDELRRELMPYRRKEPLAALYEAMKSYSRHTGRIVYTSYVLLGGINDRMEYAEELAAYLEGLSTRVNLIPYNQVSTKGFCPPTKESLSGFMEALRSRHIPVFLRNEKGGAIDAACGQLGFY